MKLVILEGYSTNPGDLSWDGLRKLGELTVYERSDEREIIERAAGADAVFVSRLKLNDERISALRQLKYIGVLGTGVNVIDLESAQRHGITVCNAPSYSSCSVAQHTMALVLAVTNNVADCDRAVRDGIWTGNSKLSGLYEKYFELCGMTFGIIGFGSIGRKVAKAAQGFGMNVIASRNRGGSGMIDGVEICATEEVLRKSDFISLNCPLTEKTHRLINRKTISAMKDGAVIINTSRGGVIDEGDLAEALETGKIRAAAVDVLGKEPSDGTSPLLTAKNCIVTPHIAWTSKQARKRLIEITADNLRAFISGSPKNRVC